MLLLGATNAPAQAHDQIVMAAIAVSSNSGKTSGKLPAASLLSQTTRALRLPNFGTRMKPAALNSTYYSKQDSGSASHWQQQTANYGAVGFESDANRASLAASSANQPADHFSLNQQRLNFDDGWRMDNSLGEQRTRTQSMVGSGYQYSLPDAPFMGIAARSYTHNTEINWTAGHTGFIKGKKIKSFETTRGEITGLSARQSLAPSWRLAWQGWMMRDNPETSTQRNLAGAVEYVNPYTHRQHTLHLAQDDKEHWGSWIDSDQRAGSWRQRYGFYHFEPQLRWINKATADDREGLYWQTDHERGDTAWFGGLDFENTNVHAAPRIAGLIKTFGFIGVKQRFNTRTSIGGSIRTGIEGHGSGAPAPRAQIHKLKLFLERKLSIGESRIGAHLYKRASMKKPEERLEFFWNQVWLDNGSDTFKTLLGLTNATRGDEALLIPATGFKLAYAITRHFDLEGSMQYLWQDTGSPEENAASHASLGANWLLDQHWRISLGGRWDGEVLKEDDANRGLLNRIDFTIAYKPSDM